MVDVASTIAQYFLIASSCYCFFALCISQHFAQVIGSGNIVILVVECRTCDREVEGSSLTHCAVDHSPGQAAQALCHQSVLYGTSGGAVILRR